MSDSPVPPRAGSRKKPIAKSAIALNIVAWSLLFAGASVVTVGSVAPEKVEAVYGDVVISVKKVAAEISPELPRITLGVEGGARELDWCNGEFIEMVSYRAPSIPQPTYAAHNNCGGDIILSWSVGDKISLSNNGKIYEVAASTDVAKFGPTSQLEGLPGEILLQTCYYGQDLMRIISLSEVSSPVERILLEPIVAVA